MARVYQNRRQKLSGKVKAQFYKDAKKSAYTYEDLGRKYNLSVQRVRELLKAV